MLNIGQIVRVTFAAIVVDDDASEHMELINETGRVELWHDDGTIMIACETSEGYFIDMFEFHPDSVFCIEAL